MSWDKNTINCSHLNAVKQTLDNLGIEYCCTTIGRFSGRGTNDDPYMDGTETLYFLQRLQYGTRVILEYAVLDADCDVDDVIHSSEFDLKDEPKDWEAVRHTDIFGEPPWET